MVLPLNGKCKLTYGPKSSRYNDFLNYHKTENNKELIKEILKVIKNRKCSIVVKNGKYSIVVTDGELMQSTEWLIKEGFPRKCIYVIERDIETYKKMIKKGILPKENIIHDEFYNGIKKLENIVGIYADLMGNNDVVISLYKCAEHISKNKVTNKIPLFVTMSTRVRQYCKESKRIIYPNRKGKLPKNNARTRKNEIENIFKYYNNECNSIGDKYYNRDSKSQRMVLFKFTL